MSRLFSSTPLSSSGRPILLDDEVEIKIEDGVLIVTQSDNKVTGELYPSGLVCLTNLRLITIFAASVKNKEALKLIGWGIFLKDILSAEDCRSLFSSSTRVKILVRDGSTKYVFSFFFVFPRHCN